MSLSGNATECAYDTIEARRVPSLSGVNLLNRGMIQVGATNWTVRRKRVAAAQHHSQADDSAHWKKKSTPAIKIPPRDTVRMALFIKSVMKVMRVVRLKPNLASITKVP